MNFWCTSESAMDVSPYYSSSVDTVGAMEALEVSLNKNLQQVDTGEWRRWCVIFMIVNENHIRDLNFHETRRLTRKDMTLDFRSFVDHKASVNADFNQCVDLMVPALERTLPYFSKAKISKETQEIIRGIIHLSAEEAKASAATKQ